MSVVVLFAIAAAFVAVVGSGLRWERRVDDAWKQAAERLGIPFRPTRRTFLGLHEASGRFLRGTVDHHDVSVSVDRRSSGRDGTRYTRYRVEYPSLELGLEVMRADFMRRVLSALGRQDIEVGDAEFDQAVIIRGDDPQRVQFFLSSARRMALHRLIQDHPGARITDTSIEVSERGVARNPAVIVTKVKRLASVAATLTGALPGLGATESALEVQRRGELARAARLLREAARETADDPETRRLEGEALYANREYESASGVFRRLRQQLPADPWASEWAQMAERRAASPPETPGTAAAAPPEMLGATAAEVADALFDPAKLSFEATRVFEAAYEGKRVRWSGVLRRHSNYRSDLDFPGGPGTKAIFEVHTLRADLYGGRDVDAVVQLPAEAASRLDADRDGRFTFAGTLVKMDTLMRNLYLADGELE